MEEVQCRTEEAGCRIQETAGTFRWGNSVAARPGGSLFSFCLAKVIEGEYLCTHNYSPHHLAEHFLVYSLSAFPLYRPISQRSITWLFKGCISRKCDLRASLSLLICFAFTPMQDGEAVLLLCNLWQSLVNSYLPTGSLPKIKTLAGCGVPATQTNKRSPNKAASIYREACQISCH